VSRPISLAPHPLPLLQRAAARDLLQLVLVAGIGAMLAATLLTGTLDLYVNGVLKPLVVFSLGVLALQALALGLSPAAPAACALDGCAHGHPARRLTPRRLLSLGALALPIVLGLLVPPQVLGSAAIAGRDISAVPTPAPVVQTASSFDMNQAYEPAGDEPDPLKRNVLQWRRLISGTRDPLKSFSGQPVSLIGFVYHAPTDGPDRFTIARYIIRCCVADAVPLGLPVQSAEARTLKPDTWIHVQGTFGAGSANGQPALVILPQRIEPTQQPSTPYINGLT